MNWSLWGWILSQHIDLEFTAIVEVYNEKYMIVEQKKNLYGSDKFHFVNLWHIKEELWILSLCINEQCRYSTHNLPIVMSY